MSTSVHDQSIEWRIERIVGLQDTFQIVSQKRAVQQAYIAAQANVFSL